jgi:hypothetical protein
MYIDTFPGWGTGEFLAPARASTARTARGAPTVVIEDLSIFGVQILGLRE